MTSLPRQLHFHIFLPGNSVGIPRPGFSLLEMLIVLAIMAGMMALVWPGLRRAVDRSILDEATNTFRSVLNESRVQALQSGSPWLIRLQSASSHLQSGTIEQFVIQTENGHSSNNSRRAENGSMTFGFDQSLSEHLVEAFSMQMDSELESSKDSLASEPNFISLPDPVQVVDLIWNTDRQSLNFTQESLDQVPAGMPEGVWWIPVLANGNIQDFGVRLHDASTGRSIWLVYSGTSGAIEVIP